MEMPSGSVLQVGYERSKKDRLKGILNQLQEEVPDQGEVLAEEIMKEEEEPLPQGKEVTKKKKPVP